MKDFAFETKINVYDSTALLFLNYEKIHSVDVSSKIRPGDVSSFDYGYNYFILMDLNIHIGASDTLVVAFGFWPKILGGSRDLRISCYFVTL